MGRSNRRALIGLGLAAFMLTACSQGEVAGIVSEDPPVKVEKNEATGLSRLTLSAKAAERLGIATGAVSAAGTALGWMLVRGRLMKIQRTFPVFTNSRSRVGHTVTVKVRHAGH